MINVIRRSTPPKQSFSQRLNLGVGKALEQGEQIYKEHQEKEAIEKLYGKEAVNLPEDFRKAFIEGKRKENEMAEKLRGNREIIAGIEKERGLEPGTLKAFESDPEMAEKVTKPQKTEGGVTAQAVPPKIASSINKILKSNPKASADDLRIAMDEAGIPPIYSNAYTENRRKTEEQINKSSEEHIRALRQETLPIRKQIADKAMAATQGIQNKEHLLDLIEKGDINDPTFATLAEQFPLNLGKRLLSNDTVEYKSGLIEEFGDLRNLFQGQTRIKEIDLLEQKIADLYLTDDQKKAILRSRINALKSDQIRAEVAQEMENEPFGVLQFENELQKRSQPRLEGLFNRILDEQKAIIQDAENKKKVKLDFNDPEDKKIAESIIKEVGGDRTKARELAKKKGYSF